jgi:hypothetical protein
VPEMDGHADHLLQKYWDMNYSILEITATLGSKHGLFFRHELMFLTLITFAQTKYTLNF